MSNIDLFTKVPFKKFNMVALMNRETSTLKYNHILNLINVYMQFEKY